MKLFFLGIGGTLMGNLALLAREAGFEVSGSDQGIYPPMSTVLADAGIPVQEGWDPAWLQPPPDLVVVGNAGLPRGHPAIEYILENNLPYTSGAAWLGDHILRQRWVLAVAGTHGKTTTTSMLAWILEHAGRQPGYLVGGVPKNFERSARLGAGEHFVVEADEYDTSYFDRRSKFVHYRPRTLIINNLEYDHADIFEDLGAIQTQFHNLLRTVPGGGRILAPRFDDNIDEVLARGCWTPIQRIAPLTRPRGRKIRQHERDTDALWSARHISTTGSHFTVCRNDEELGEVDWQLIGNHNISNALAAVAAADHADVPVADAIKALGCFEGVKRRMELIWQGDDLRIYDDFAHHPTAIRTTLQGLRDQVGGAEIIAVIEPRSHTMSLGSLREDLVRCCAPADQAWWFRTDKLTWDLSEVTRRSVVPARMSDDVDQLVRDLVTALRRPAHRPRHVVIMSNGAFGGLHEKLKTALDAA